MGDSEVNEFREKRKKTLIFSIKNSSLCVKFSFAFPFEISIYDESGFAPTTSEA